MVSVHLRYGHRPRGRRTGPTLVASLVAGVLAAAALLPAWASPAPARPVPAATTTDIAPEAVANPATDPAEGSDDATPTPTAEPTSPPPTEPVPSEPAPSEPGPSEPGPTGTTTPPPAPATTAPAPTGTAPPPPAAPTTTIRPAGPHKPPAGQPGRSTVGVQVTTGDVTLTGAYWNARSTVATLRVTVTNTGSAAERLRLGYTLPVGLTDAGTPGCARAGGRDYRCGAWTVEPGARFSSPIRVRVSADAWRWMPLTGTVRVDATAVDGTGKASDHEGFAVLFPPGPPVPGIALDADEVAFDISGAPSSLEVLLGNTGKVHAAGLVELVLPTGVTTPNPPAGCRATEPTRTRCELGRVPAGRTATLRIPIAATADAQREAPLAGAVVGELSPLSGRTKRVQMSFRITAAAALDTPVAAAVPTGSQGALTAGHASTAGDGFPSTTLTAIAVVTGSGLVVVLALVLATSSLRRRFAPPPEPSAAPAGSE